MSWLSRFSLAQRALIGLMSIIALLFGAIAIPQLKQQLLPSIELPMVSVLAPYPGASPDVVEKQVVEPLEKSIDAVEGITGITATASEGNAVLMAQFDFGSAGTQQLRRRHPAGRQPLPRDAAGRRRPAGRSPVPPTTSRPWCSPSPPTRTSRPSPDSWSGPSSPRSNRSTASARSPWTASANSRSPVTPDDADLAKAGLSSADLVQALQAAGATVPAGSFDEKGENRTVQVGGGFTSVKQIEDLRIAPAGRRPGRSGRPGCPGGTRRRRQGPRARPPRLGRQGRAAAGHGHLADPHQR